VSNPGLQLRPGFLEAPVGAGPAIGTRGGPVLGYPVLCCPGLPLLGDCSTWSPLCAVRPGSPLLGRGSAVLGTGCPGCLQSTVCAALPEGQSAQIVWRDTEDLHARTLTLWGSCVRGASPCGIPRPSFLGTNRSLLNFLFPSYIHMCIRCLDHFSLLPSAPSLTLSGRTCFALFSSFVEEKI
jgi:hypothetical protein